MSLYYSTIANKPNIKLTGKDGTVHNCIDLLPSVVNMEYNPANCNRCIVNKYYVARPDLISLAFYGTDEYADIICKINGISNPFELNEDDMLDIPPLEMVRYFANNDITSSELINSKTNITSTSKVRQKQLNQKRKPGEQIVGDTNYVIDKSLGLIFY